MTDSAYKDFYHRLIAQHLIENNNYLMKLFLHEIYY